MAPSSNTLERTIEPALARNECEHMAALVRSAGDLPPLLASFFRLGASRNGWLVHGSLPGEADADRSRLSDAGLDVASLEATGQLSVLELDLTASPDEWVKPWSALLEERLGSGYDALWFARFPIGPTDNDVAGVLPFEGAWMDCFRGRRVVTLCPYIVGGLDEDARRDHAERVAAVHDQVLDFSRR
jgi:hypothetical protein